MNTYKIIGTNIRTLQHLGVFLLMEYFHTYWWCGVGGTGGARQVAALLVSEGLQMLTVLSFRP